LAQAGRHTEQAGRKEAESPQHIDAQLSIFGFREGLTYCSQTLMEPQGINRDNIGDEVSSEVHVNKTQVIFSFLRDHAQAADINARVEAL
jgi:hypothetical protein